MSPQGKFWWLLVYCCSTPLVEVSYGFTRPNGKPTSIEGSHIGLKGLSSYLPRARLIRYRQHVFTTRDLERQMQAKPCVGRPRVRPDMRFTYKRRQPRQLNIHRSTRSHLAHAISLIHPWRSSCGGDCVCAHVAARRSWHVRKQHLAEHRQQRLVTAEHITQPAATQRHDVRFHPVTTTVRAL